MAQKLEVFDATCLVFNKMNTLIDSILESPYTPDLIAVDFMSFRHDFFNVYDYMKSFNRLFPLIFYNDPLAPEGQRTEYWSGCILFSGYEADIQPLRKYLILLEELIESPQFGPYISLIQKPLPYPYANEDTKTNSNVFANEVNPEYKQTGKLIYSLRKKYSIPQGVFNLFEFLYKNLGNDISIEELINLYGGYKKKATLNSLKIALSRLRKTLESITEVQLDLLSTSNGYKLIEI